ncbi:tetratricopeptide repeat-containing sensor histidine kinase [Mucilaginibacter psychrotolerans]|uniref:tetratricopeptide repeat-containing sensor histidine kinase n=1 Tax=Mucilaginibacter psychrotolerans TaxID=1524096 RepID=UPI0013051E70|nr:histidine kinase dimerization/phosphoacceptor domain -containing protein [Mucilaginibacter psychrotolerans]
MLGSAQLLIDRPGEIKANFNLAEKYGRHALALSTNLSYQKGIGQSFFTLSKISKARKDIRSGSDYLMKSINVFRADSSLREFEADADIELANYYGINEAGDLANKIRLYEQAANLLALKLPNSLKLADALKYLGDLYNVKEDNEKSISSLQKALKIYKSLKYDKLQDIYCLLGAVLNRNGASREGLRYLQLAEKDAVRYRDSSSTVTTMYNRMGNIYNSLNQYKQTNKAFEKSIIYARKNHDKDAVLMVSANLGWSYLRVNKSEKAVRVIKEALLSANRKDTAHIINLNTTLMEAYIQRHDLANASKCNASIKDMIRQFYLYDFLLINYHHAAAKLYLKLRDFTNCQSQINATKTITNRSSNIRDMAAAEKLQYQLDSARSRPWEALKHLNLFMHLNDSLNTRNHDREINQLQIAYESEKKDLDISSLKQRASLREKILISEKAARNFSMAGMALFLILTLLLFSRYRLKQKTNRELQIKQNAINGQNLSLKHLLNERDWLIKEVHHRVKNNLQIIISLLDSQSSYLLDENALVVLRESRHRMHSISLVHQKLYQDENLTGINIKDYISELIGFLKDSFGIEKKIRFELDVEPLLFDVSQVVPLGLILNEAVTNSIKYAFQNQSECVISIAVRATTDNFVEISIADNGCGLPPDFDIDSCSSLGMNLIKGLTAQIQGKLSVFSANGMHICIQVERLRTLGSKPAPGYEI